MKNQTFATLLFAIALCFASAVSAAPPDLTNGGVATDSNTTNLGPTGMRGWTYHVHADTSESRQIQITTVDAGSPAAGFLAVNDVILGANGTGASPANFTSDARKSLGLAIADAEARNPAILKLIRWRSGATATVQIALQTMGAYSATAPYNCPKSSLILEQGLQNLMTSGTAGNFSLGTLALMAGNDIGNPNNAARQARAQSEARALIPNAALMALMNSDDQIETTSKVVWTRGHQLIVLAEYYLQTGDTLVLPGIQAMAKSIAKGQSLFGTMGHLFADKWPDGSLNGPMGGVYGPVNSAGLPTLYGLLLAKQCGVNIPHLDPAIERGSRFFAYYAGRGAIPYGEHDAGRDGYENNGKSGLAALAFSLQNNRTKECKIFSKMAASSSLDREIGHTGPFFNMLWAPLGANVGGEAAVESYFSQTSWLYDLARRWDGSFVYESIDSGGAGSYASFTGSTPFLLTYALPLHQLTITGKNANPTVMLSGADIAEVAAAPQYVAATRTTNELVADLGSWSTVIQTKAVAELGLRPSEQAALLPTLHALASDVNGTSRVGACWALGKIASGSSAPILAALLTDPDNKVRHAAAENLRYLPQASKMSVLNTILAAAASTAEPLLPLDEEDPLHMAQGRLGLLLFYSGTAYGPKGMIWGSGINGVDRNLLYPAIRAIAASPIGQVRSTLTETYKNLTPADFQSLADVIVETVRYRAPADKMFSQGIRQSGLELLQSKGYAEGVPLAMIYEKDDGRDSVTSDVLSVLDSYAGSSLTVVPDPSVITYLNSFLNDQTHVTEVQAVLDALAADTNPTPLTPLKSIQSVTADASVLILPAKWTMLRASAIDLAKGDSVYTWRKVHGAGDVSFTPNGSGDAKNTTVLFDGAPGQYLFEVKMSDSRGFTEVYRTVSVTLKNTGGSLPINAPPTADPQSVTLAQAAPTPITLTGTDPEGYALHYSVTIQPAHGKLSGTVPYLVYTSDFDYSGPDSFTFQAMDSEGQMSAATVNITISAGINVPVAIYEPFAQAAGQLVGKPGGIGFSGNWAGSNSTRTQVAAGSLSFGTLPVAGNHIETTTSNGILNISTGTTLSNAGLMANGAELWFSFLHVNPNNSNITPTLVLGNQNVSGSATIANSGSGIGVKLYKGNAPQAMIFNAGTQLTSDSQSLIAPSQTALIVGHIIWGADAASPDTIEIYTPGTDLLLDTPQSVSAVLDQSTFNKFSIYANATAPVMDEFRFGASYHSVLVGNTAMSADSSPPLPNPLGFASVPKSVGLSAIGMTAATAYDISGVEYYFTCNAGGGHDSGWQTGTTYTDTGLTPGVQYSYTVKARDKSPARNVTTTSPAASAIIATQVVVPNVVGMMQSSGESILSSTGLVIGTVTSSYSNIIPSGIVISQDPTGELNGSLGSTVNLVVSQGIDPAQAPTISPVKIVDDQGGISVVENTVTTYTFTFSKDMDLATVSAADFSNAGTSAITIGSIRKLSSGVLAVEVTPTSIGTLQLQIPAGASLKDVFGVSLDTSSATVDDNTLMVTSAGGIDAVVYEPFDYATGALAGKNGGVGMAGAWADGPETNGVAGVFDQTTATAPADRGTGILSWDGVFNNLPTLPASGAKYAALLNSAGDKWEAYRPLAQDAGTMAGANKVLWASMVWHKAGGGFGHHVGFALTTDSFMDRGKKLNTSGSYGSGAGDGIGVAESAINSGKYSAAVFHNGVPTAITTSGSLASGDYILVLKIEFGAIDTISTYAFPEAATRSEAAFNTNKISANAAVDESKLNMVAFSNVRGEPAFDEIRIGPTFASVLGSATIPGLVGLPQASAEAKLVGGKLLVGTETMQNDPVILAGKVIGQNPVAGSIAIQGASVNLIISLGPSMTTVPNVVGLVQATAETNIAGANLAVGTVTSQYDAAVPIGKVIGQNPVSGGSLAQGSPINLVVSLGPPMATVPNVVGIAQTPAEASITAADLVLGTVTSQSSETVPTGDVISQSPTSGAIVAEGSAVNMVVSAGDLTAPTPNPMTFAVEPVAISESSIVMTATEVTDANGVEYNFICTAGGGHDSGWQDSPTYTDTGLSPVTQYTYQVRARDKSPAQNVSDDSANASATTMAAVVVDDYVTWTAANQVPGGPNDDWDSDGLSNFGEYAFGLLPNNCVSVNPIIVPFDKSAGTFTYTRRSVSLTKVTYTVRSSTTLTFNDWNPLVKDTDYTELVTGTFGEVESVKVTLSPGLLASPQFFVQVRATD